MSTQEWFQLILNDFSSTASDIIDIIIPVVGAGLGIFAVIYGVKLAKHMFETISGGNSDYPTPDTWDWNDDPPSWLEEEWENDGLL